MSAHPPAPSPAAPPQSLRRRSVGSALLALLLVAQSCTLGMADDAAPLPLLGYLGDALAFCSMAGALISLCWLLLTLCHLITATP